MKIENFEPSALELEFESLSCTPKIVHHFNFDAIRTRSLFLWPPSLTVPDQVMSMEEMISRFTRNQAVPTVPMVNVDTDVSEFDGMDVFQIIDYKRKLAARIQLLNSQKLKEEQTARDIEQRRLFDVAVANQVKAELETLKS